MRKLPTFVWVTLSSWGNRFTQIFVQLESIRIAIRLLGPEQYSAYVLISSLAVWLSLSDFGIGPALQNFISEQRLKAQNYLAVERRALCAAQLGALLVIAGILLVGPAFATFLLKGQLGVPAEQKRYAIVAGCVMFVGSAIGSIVFKIWYAEQKGYFANLVPAAGALLGYLSILRLNSIGTATLVEVLMASFLPTSMLCTLVFLSRFLRAEFKYRSNKQERQDFSLLYLNSRNFMIFAFMTALTLQLDYIIMSQTLSPSEIVSYSLVTKIFTIPNLLFMGLLNSLWPTFTGLMKEKNSTLVYRMIKKIVIISIALLSLFSILLILGSDFVLAYLAPNNSKVMLPAILVMFAFFYHCILIWVSSFSIFLQSANLLKVFIRWTPVQILISVVCQWTLSKQVGASGILIGLLISYLLTAVWLMPYTLKKHFKNDEGSALA